MDQSTGALNDANDDLRSRKRSVEDIERDIHQTQSEMSRTIDSIQYRLSPDYMKSRARMKMKDTSRGMMDRIRENPGAAAVTGLGLFMLLRGSSSSDTGHDEIDSYDYVMICDACGVSVYEHEGRDHGFTERMRDRGSDLRHKASGAAHTVGEKASDVKHSMQESAGRMSERAHSATKRARRKARSAGRRTQRKFDEDPLLMGAIGIAAGALLGALIPETDRERELMGEARDDLMHRSRELAREKGEQIRQVAQHAKDAAVEEAKHESKRQNLTGSDDDPIRPHPTI